ncbi:ATP-dependent DNA helicase RRM3-like [Rutidosis leptorrhynchoides]|uniref:ATP-dependent DNA helicase RRM3-like n=1 Tax=Rutidosis leptorrhynchoides TaxID=125765 RepID=UPI003A9A65FE
MNETEKLLHRNGKSLKNYPSMPYPSSTVLNLSDSPFIIDELSYNMSELEIQHAELISRLNTDQKKAYDTIVSAVTADKGGAFFVYGSGGTGKTFLWNTLSAALRSRSQIMLNVASRGIFALLFPGRRTAHSHFGIPIDPKDESYFRIQPNSHLAELIRKTKLIIWDEAPMVNGLCVETLDRSLQDIFWPINSNSMDTPFGGKVIVFGGDL